MKPIRLNKEIRDTMVRNVRAQFAKNNPPPFTHKDIRIMRGKLARELWDLHIGDEYGEQIEVLPGRLFTCRPFVVIALHGGRMERTYLFDHEGESYELPMYTTPGNPHHVPPLAAMELADWEALNKEADDADKQHRAWELKREAAVEAARAVLMSVTTTKRLLEVWPESEELIPEAEGANLPALQTKQLNTALGIPTPT